MHAMRIIAVPAGFGWFRDRGRSDDQIGDYCWHL
jgi:hypothetical protein